VLLGERVGGVLAGRPAAEQPRLLRLCDERVDRGALDRRLIPFSRRISRLTRPAAPIAGTFGKTCESRSRLFCPARITGLAAAGTLTVTP